MAVQKISCMFDGDTFIGTFRESGRGADATVTVCYAGLERTTAVGRSSAGHMAQRLLNELVQDRLAGEIGGALA